MNSSSVSPPRPLSRNQFFHPALLVAIALHAIVLWFPLSSNSKSEASKAEETTSETAAKTEGEAASDAASSPTEATTTASPTTPTSTLSASAKKPLAVPKTAGTFALGSSQTQKTNVAKPPVRNAVTQTAASRLVSPTPKPVNSSRTNFPVPKTVPTFSRPAPFSISRATLQPSPAASPASLPSPVVSPAPAPQPSPAANPAPAPQIVAIVPATIPADPFTKFPFYPFSRSLIGSLDLQSPERDRDTYAFNTREEIQTAIAFYEKELPKELFEPLKMELDGTDMTIYAVKPKNGSKVRYLHFIPFQGRTAIILLPEKITDLKAIKAEAIERQEKRSQFLGIFSQIERIRQQMRSSQLSTIE
ncbi:hypothetical protein [Oscillatoria sp. FACHB-1406]|uniref:hypothetical protein n=1 Tax=Oscillatoria sp. FACHB-1406 TaxID=2692846 RepID=UPI001683AD8E|nr:hypothetical protein [Oscillatoria sp. FACHB-1406]MBD2578009.1 hypothetical protein [Oscillatoria sp. FACHB-1406]